MQKLNKLNISKNKLGYEGAKHLAEALKQMKSLTHLDLSNNDIGDTGVLEILKSVKDYSALEYFDLSGNRIGKTSHGIECGEILNEYLHTNRVLEHLKMNWNNLRGIIGEKIIEGLVHCYSIKTVEFNNNLLGIAYEGK